jgi:signal transduction histidine kinase/DNA-binding response OmpR family regulator/HPt (histidine-containing phosphotransfer) domain-containing protein
MDIKSLLKENSVQLFIIFAIFLFMIVFGCSWATSNLQQYMAHDAEEVLMVAEERIRGEMTKFEVIITGMATNLIRMRVRGDGEIARIEDYLSVNIATFALTEKFDLGIQDIFWFFPENEERIYISGNSWPRRIDGPAETLPWYALGAAAPGEIITTPPYWDFKSHRQIITIAMLLQDGRGEKHGYLGIDINLERIAEFVVAFHVEKGGYGYLIGPVSDADGRLRFMAYPDHRYKDIPLEDLGPQYKVLEERLTAGSEIVSSLNITTVADVEVVAFYRKTHNGWYAGIAFPRQEYFRSVYTTSIIYTITSLIMMVILCYFLLRLSMDKMQSDEENKAKSSFLAQVSHEIRTPLNSILGMSEIILRKNVSPDIYEDVSIIKQAGNILLSIINNILDFAKIETKKISIDINPYNMASMINDVINIARLRLMDRPVDFFVDMDSNIPAQLLGDEVKIRQILINLLNNAIKYTKLGYIKISIKKESLPPSSFGDSQVRIVFSVEDTGVGIKQMDIERLFEEFTRLDMEHNYDIEGTGLGLTIANSFCQAMGGNITAVSTYGKGSTFTAKIVQTYNDGKHVAQLEDPAKRVLVYEDRPAYLQSLLTAFSSLGLQPQCAWDLPSFMQNIREGNFDYAFIPARYAADCTGGLESPESSVKVMVMLNNDDMSSSFNANSVHLPIYSSTLANILNGSTEMGKHVFHTERIGFAAPDARILVVDDLPTNLRVAEELLKPYGMKIDTCLSGTECLDLIKRNHYDIVFMDHMMPEMDGLLTTDLIRKQGKEWSGNSYFRDLPIIMLTANAIAGQREIFLKNGINDFLAKPINVSKLNSILITWIPKEKQQKISPAAGKKLAPPAESGGFHLPAIPGVEVQAGLHNAGGSPDSYLSILSYFCADIEERIPQIRESVERGDLSSYTTMVHAVKGASRSIGAMELGDMAAELESAGRGGDSGIIAAKTGALLERLRELAGYIHSALGKPAAGPEDAGVPVGEIEEPSPQDIADLNLETLKDALKNLDTERVNAFFAKIEGSGRNPAVKKIISRIGQYILLFEYDRAVEVINAVLPPPPPPPTELNRPENKIKLIRRNL